MQEIVPGIRHWMATHPRWDIRVSSYYVEPARTLLDPMLPETDDEREILRALDPAPAQIVLTNRHHYRASDTLREQFGGIPVRASRPGLHEFEGGPPVDGFDYGDTLASEITAIEIGGICPDDTALHIEVAGGAIAFADALIRPPGQDRVCFVPDSLMDDPPATKEAVLASLRRVLELDFEHLLFAHGEPLVGDGRAAIEGFLENPIGEDDLDPSGD